MRLLEPVHDGLARYCRAMSRSRDDARDLLGDVVLAAYDELDRLRDEDAFRPFVLTIARRMATRKRERAQRFEPLPSNAHDVLPAQSNPEIDADVALLYEALAKLPRTQQEAIALFEIAGLPLEEIRLIQGGSLSGVKSRVARGRASLASLLGARDTKGKAGSDG